MFSTLTDTFDVPTNPLYQERDRRLAAGKPVIDLVSGNVTAHGIEFPPSVLKDACLLALGQPSAYAPDPRGQRAAREAIAGFYASEGMAVSAEQIILTSGTSLSYAYAFKLLANAGEEILCPRPCYPLFESIAEFCNVKCSTYPLRRGPKRWEIDFSALAAAITPRTRAIVLISPHNPTGHVATSEELRQLAELAQKHQLPLIVDEVFSPFVYSGDLLPRFPPGSAPLVLTLNGFSKMLALPGLKVGWMVLTGDSIWVEKALKRLEFFSDTYLPVNEMVQAMIASLLSQGQAFLREYRGEILKRRDLALRLLSSPSPDNGDCPRPVNSIGKGMNDPIGDPATLTPLGPRLQISGATPFTIVAPEGGFFIALGLPEGSDEDAITLRLLKEEGILVHPGHFYEFETPHLVMSFVSETGIQPCILGLQRLLDG